MPSRVRADDVVGHDGLRLRGAGPRSPLGAQLHVAGEAAAGEAVVDLVHADQRREGVGALIAARERIAP